LFVRVGYVSFVTKSFPTLAVTYNSQVDRTLRLWLLHLSSFLLVGQRNGIRLVGSDFCAFIDEKLAGILLARDIFLSVRDLNEH
jgi:hypothetical protein